MRFWTDYFPSARISLEFFCYKLSWKCPWWDRSARHHYVKNIKQYWIKVKNSSPFFPCFISMYPYLDIYVEKKKSNNYRNLWISSYIIKVFLTQVREQELVLKNPLHLHNFSQNLVAAYTSSLLPWIWQILNKVSLSTVTAAYPRGASIADGIFHLPALFSPVCPCTYSFFIQNSMAEKQSYLKK